MPKESSTHRRRDTRRDEAAARRAISDKRTPEERIALLDALFGADLGATKERARMHKAIKDRNKAAKKASK
jgi:hypothetical protein